VATAKLHEHDKALLMTALKTDARA